MILNDFVLDQFHKTSVYTSFQLLFLCVSVLYIFKHPQYYRDAFVCRRGRMILPIYFFQAY